MGTRGSMRAARFIADQFRLAGLTPAGDSGFFQHVPLFVRSVDRSSTITVDGTTLKLGTDFSVAPGRADPRTIDGVQVVYGGVRGEAEPLTADQVRGKLVIFRAAPAAQAPQGAPPQRAAAAPSCRDTAAYAAFMGARGGGNRGGGGGGGRGFGGGGGNLASRLDELAARSQILWSLVHKWIIFL